MKKALLLADSGGTRTDWCLIEASGNSIFFETESYHPHLITENWIHKKKAFWQDYTDNFDLEVKFYGSGCIHIENKKKLEKAFNYWGITNVEIESDILAAAKASFGDSDGLVAILGTGSVLATIKNNSIKEIYGGFGHLLGDEGSGYFFGKTLLQKFFKKEFSDDCMNYITEHLGSKADVLKNVYDENSENSKNYISSLSALFPSTFNQEFENLHVENIRLFLVNYLPHSKMHEKLFFIGSYAYYNADILQKILPEYNFQLGEIHKRPIIKLADYHKIKCL